MFKIFDSCSVSLHPAAFRDAVKYPKSANETPIVTCAVAVCKLEQELGKLQSKSRIKIH